MMSDAVLSGADRRRPESKKTVPEVFSSHGAEGQLHIVGIVLFGFDVDVQGETVPNNFIAAAFLKHMRLRGS
jgi:hypothetical protein